MNVKLKKTLVLFLVMALLISVVGCGTNSATDKQGAKSTQKQAAETDQLKSQLFVDASWLKDNFDKVVVIDARADKDYNKGHIAGAVNASWQSLCNMSGKPGEKGWGVMLPASQLAEKLGQMGINGDKTVIVYAAPPGWGEEGCVVWMLKSAGIKNAKMLDGGFKAWKDAGGEINEDVPKPTPVKFSIASIDEGLNATTDFILSNQKNIKIVDSRSEKEYKGATDYGEARGGHLPGAINIPFETMFNQDGTLKSSTDLKKIFTDAGLKPSDEIVTYCTAGIRSAHMALVLRMVGFEKARNYDASYYEWAGNKSLTVEK
jgi:thiosulfate/3-mercaptopyruvate sulfurtransferase